MKRLILVLSLSLLTSCGGGAGGQSGASWVGNWLLLYSDGASITDDTTLNFTTSGFSIRLGADLAGGGIPCIFGGSWYGDSSGFIWNVTNGNCSNVPVGSIIQGSYSVSDDGQNLSINFTSDFTASGWIAQLLSR